MAKKPKGPVQVRRVSDQTTVLKLASIMTMVKRGCAVFPVVPYKKKPGIKNWGNKASKDVRRIKEYFLANANSNYGIVTGAPSDIFVVDLDGIEGVRNFRRLENEYGRCAPTVTGRSPRGLHLYFRAPKHRVPNSVSCIARGVDIKGDGGYVSRSGQ